MRKKKIQQDLSETISSIDQTVPFYKAQNDHGPCNKLYLLNVSLYGPLFRELNGQSWWKNVFPCTEEGSIRLQNVIKCSKYRVQIIPVVRKPHNVLSFCNLSVPLMRNIV